eukprot:m.273195 g.273195  ORF g.273195 m.273195 type:complete len:85 (+) comp54814_c0_seq31:499-753(+)
MALMAQRLQNRDREVICSQLPACAQPLLGEFEPPLLQHTSFPAMFDLGQSSAYVAARFQSLHDNNKGVDHTAPRTNMLRAVTPE